MKGVYSMNTFKNHITKEELQTIDRIRDDCKKLHILNPPACFLSYDLKDADGKQIEAHHMLSKSWVRNFYVIMAQILMGASFKTGSADPDALTYGPGTLCTANISGAVPKTSRDSMQVPLGLWGTDLKGIAGKMDSVLGELNTTMGIVLGSSDSPETFESAALSSIITSGAAAGQLSYQAQINPEFIYDAATGKYTIIHKRIFNNNSGEPIIVKEIGWYRRFGWHDTSDRVRSDTYLLSRDVLPAPVSIPDAGQFTVSYTLEQIFPE